MTHKHLPTQGGNSVLLLVDWENVFFGLFTDFGPDRMHLDVRFKNMTNWVTENIGELLGGYGFVFAPEHFSMYHGNICVENNLKTVICPKRQIEDRAEDTVDETIIWFGKMMLKHPEVKFLCLVSGDEDFVPLLQEAKKRGVRVALIVPTLSSISPNKILINYIDRHPKTGEKMVLRLDQAV